MFLLQYVGDDNTSFIFNSIYEVEEVQDEFRKGYAIFDEGDDWYWYSSEFVEKNFITPTFKGEDE